MSKTFFSKFANHSNKDIVVGIITKDDARYETLKPIFNAYGFGFTDPRIGCVFIDGEAGLNEDQLKWVEAHEVAHILLKHTNDGNDKDELEADTLAYKLLSESGYNKAAKLVKQHSIKRHGYQI